MSQDHSIVESLITSAAVAATAVHRLYESQSMNQATTAE